WTKSHLGRSPLSTPLGYEAGTASSLGSARDSCCGSWYCHHTRLPWAAGPMAGCFPPPGLPWPSGVPAAGSLAPGNWEQLHTRVRPWGVEVPSTEEQARPIECLRHLCDRNQSRGEKRSTQG